LERILKAGEENPAQERSAMQISDHQTQKVLQHAPRASKARTRPPVKNVAELARRYEVNLEEAKAVTQRMHEMEEDPARAARVRDIAQRIANGTYDVAADQIIDLAARRAIVDRIR
jgi:anti-sigma28 factor (negative regulator of flagellin synthesis)